MKKSIKIILVVISVLIFIFVGVAISATLFTANYFSDDDVYGDIILLKEGDIHIGDTVPMVFVVPGEFSDLHKEMWDCYIDENGDLIDRFEYVIENDHLEEVFTDDGVNALFSKAPIDITDGDGYSSRIAVFKPEEAGDYHISIFGYYHSTSPQGYGGIDITVLE